MQGKLKLLGLLGVVAAAVMVPLYGDARNAPVTHAEWARMMLRALDLEATAEQSASASQAFAILSWKNSLAFRADRYVRADGISRIAEGGIAAVQPGAEAAYAVAVVRGGDYRLRLQMAGNQAEQVLAEITPLGKTQPVATFGLSPAAEIGWSEARPTYLDPGAYTAAFVLPAGTNLARLEVAPPCLDAIEPLSGWQASAVLSSEDVAVTVVKALDLESELAPADIPFERSADAFQTESPSTRNAALASLSPELVAGPEGLQARVFIDIPADGLYSVSVFGLRGAGQSWTADACRKSVLCPSAEPARVADWHVVMTTEFAQGRHSLSVNLAPGASIERVRIERKKETASDYVAALRRAGFDVGAPGPMPRPRAVDAMNFIQGRKLRTQALLCGEPVLPEGDQVETALAQPAGPVAGPQQPPPFTGNPPPIGVPTVPVPSPGPPATPPPTVPTPLPTQSPASPVTVGE